MHIKPVWPRLALNTSLLCRYVCIYCSPSCKSQVPLRPLLHPSLSCILDSSAAKGGFAVAAAFLSLFLSDFPLAETLFVRLFRIHLCARFAHDDSVSPPHSLWASLGRQPEQPEQPVSPLIPSFLTKIIPHTIPVHLNRQYSYLGSLETDRLVLDPPSPVSRLPSQPAYIYIGWRAARC